MEKYNVDICKTRSDLDSGEMSFFRNGREEYNAPATTARAEDNVDIQENFLPVNRPPLRRIDRYIRPQIPFLTKRSTVAFLSCIGFMIAFGMDTGRDSVNAEVDMDIKIAVMHATYFGFVITQILGGLLAVVFPANMLFGAAILLCSLLNLWHSIFSMSKYFQLANMILQDLAQGVLYPTCIGVLRHWAPPLERSRLLTLAFSGAYASIPIYMLLTYLLEKTFLSGKVHFLFCVYGILGILWYVSWIWLVFEKPASHTFIDTKELAFIESSLGESLSREVISRGRTRYAVSTLRNVPWKALFTSPPFYATVVANFCRSCSYSLTMYLLVYLSAVFQSDILYFSELSTFLVQTILTITLPIGGILADWLQKRKFLTTTQVRKLFTCTGFGVEAICLLIITFTNIFPLTVTIFCIQIVFRGLGVCGYDVNHLDIAPRYASILMGISKGIGAVAAFVCVYAVYKAVLQGNIENWWPLPIIFAVIYCFGLVFYGVFASGEEQRWARPTLRQQTLGRTSNEIPMHTI